MQVKWRLYRFDYQKFNTISPELSAAEHAADFEPLAANNLELESLILSVDAGKTLPAKAKHLFVIALCCRESPVDLDRSFARTVSTLCRMPKTEEIGRKLQSVFGGSTLADSWLEERVNGPLSGLLTVDQTRDLNADFEPFVKRLQDRRYDALDNIRHAFRLLLNHECDPNATLITIGEQIKNACANRDGLAVVSVNRT